MYENVRAALKTSEYDFLRTDENLARDKQTVKVDNDLEIGKNIILLGLGGSYAYGTNKEGSDIDIRGIALNSKSDILAGTVDKFEQVTETNTDTVIYSLNKIVNLLLNVNPNTIEMLGLDPDQYIYLSDEGKMLVDNAHLFLSKKCAHSFGGYANSQLYRLNQKSAHSMSQAGLEQHILKTMEFMQTDFTKRYPTMPEDSIKLYIDKSAQEGMDTEIFMDVNLNHYPLRDYCGMWNELKNVTSEYTRLGKRNSKAIEHDKIGKHMMHLVRLYLMCFDILERGEIVTYRAKEHDFLMDIRNGKYLDDEDHPIAEFYDIVDELENKLEYWKEHTELPANPDYNRINKFLADVNRQVVLNENTN